MRPGVLRRHFDRLIQIAEAPLQIRAEHRFTAKDKGLCRDRFQDDLSDVCRGAASLRPLGKGEEHPLLGVALTEGLSHVVRDQDRTEFGQLQLLGYGVGRERLVESKDDGNGLPLHEDHLDIELFERLHFVEPDRSAALILDRFGFAPCLFNVFERAHAWSNSVETGRPDFRARRSALDRFVIHGLWRRVGRHCIRWRTCHGRRLGRRRSVLLRGNVNRCRSPCW